MSDQIVEPFLRSHDAQIILHPRLGGSPGRMPLLGFEFHQGRQSLVQPLSGLLEIAHREITS